LVIVCALIILAGYGLIRGMDLDHPNPLTFPALLLVQLFFIRATTRRMSVSDRLREVTEWTARNFRKIVPTILVAAFFGSLAAVWVLRAFPNSGDEYSYLFGARTFLAGRLWNPAPDHSAFFTTWQILLAGGKWVSKYEPGWPAVLAAGRWLGLPFWAINPILGVCLLAIIAKIAWQQNGAFVAVVTLIIAFLSPFYLFMTASYFNHVLAAVFGASFIYFALDYRRKAGWQSGLFAGAALGALGLTRTFDVFVFLIPFVADLLIRNDRRQYFSVLFILVGGAPFLCALLLYNHAITGSAFMPPAQLYSPDLHLGIFPVDERGEAYPPGKTLGQAALLLVNLGEWTSPLILCAYGIAIAWRARQHTLQFYDWIFAANVTLYLLHPGAGTDRYGPRFYFESYPFFVLTIAAVAGDMLRIKNVSAYGAKATGAFVAHLAACTAGLLIFPYFLRGIVDARMDVFDQVQRLQLANAVVIVRSSTGGYPNEWDPRNLTRNGTDLRGAVIYTLDPGPQLPQLREMFPHRRFFAYERPPGAAESVLTPFD